MRLAASSFLPGLRLLLACACVVTFNAWAAPPDISGAWRLDDQHSDGADALTAMLRADAATTDAQLATLSGDELDRAYVASQARAQQRALEIIDTALVPNVMSDEIRSAIVDAVRPMVSQHLQMAKTLQASLGAM